MFTANCQHYAHDLQTHSQAGFYHQKPSLLIIFELLQIKLVHDIREGRICNLELR